MKIRTSVIVGGLAALGLATQVFAGPVTVVYQGFVDPVGSGSVDTNGLFGGGDLGGDAITATFVYDTSLGFETTDGATFDELDGGATFNDGVSPTVYASPVVSASFTIAGETYSYAPDYDSQAYTQSPASGGTPYVQETAESSASDDAVVYFITGLAPASLASSFSDAFPQGGAGYLDTAFVGPDQTFDAITFTTDSVSVSAAPEPASWMLMIAGVGLAGFALRRRPALTLA